MTPFRLFLALCVVLAASFALVMHKSANVTPPPDGAAAQSLAGAWLAEDIKGGGVIGNAQTTIAFDAGNRVHGSGGCNRFSGSATVAGDKLTFGPLAATRMMCAEALMDQEGKFLGALEACRSFRFDGAFLKFLGEDGAELMRFTRKA
jgi:putative lipoprotein